MLVQAAFLKWKNHRGQHNDEIFAITIVSETGWLDGWTGK